MYSRQTNNDQLFEALKRAERQIAELESEKRNLRTKLHDLEQDRLGYRYLKPMYDEATNARDTLRRLHGDCLARNKAVEENAQQCSQNFEDLRQHYTALHAAWEEATAESKDLASRIESTDSDAQRTLRAEVGRLESLAQKQKSELESMATQLSRIRDSASKPAPSTCRIL